MSGRQAFALRTGCGAGQRIRPSPSAWTDFINPPLARLVALRPLDLEDVPGLVAVRQAVECAFGVRLGSEGCGKVCRHGHLAWCRVEFEVDVDLVATLDPGASPVLGTHTEHVVAAHHGDGAAVGVAIDRHADRRTLALAESLHDIVGNADAGRGLVVLQERGAETHSCLLVTFEGKALTKGSTSQPQNSW